MKQIIEKYIKIIKEKRKISFRFVGTFYLLPRKRGKLYGFGEGKDIRYTHRIKFKPSLWLKDMLCK